MVNKMLKIVKKDQLGKESDRPDTGLIYIFYITTHAIFYCKKIT